MKWICRSVLAAVTWLALDPPQLENNDENRIPHFCSQKITSVAAGGVFVAGLMGAPAQAADGNFAEDADVSTTEILVTYAEEVLTAGEGEDVESVD